jgi:folate-binding protein YgfZ
MSNEWQLCELDDFGVLRLRGPDGVRFLQGQVSNDVEQLTPERSLLAGYHNPQGRAIAVLRLALLAPDDLLAILPRELAPAVASRLGKFILRAKVKIADESGAWRVTGLIAPHVVGAAGNGAGGNAGASGSSSVGGGASASRGPSVGAGASGEQSASSAGGGSGASRGPTFGGGASGESSASSAGGNPEHGAGLVPEFEARAASWAAAQFEMARARAESAGELSLAATQLENADSVVELPTASALMLPDEVNGQSRSGATAIVRVGLTPARWLILSPAGEQVPLSGCKAAGRDAWRLLDIADGIPQVYAATSEEFVAQMLNLDALGGISFEKGCYTGQEVIARAHYRGRVKRRLQRFMSRGPATLAIGESGQLTDGRAFKVVEAAQLTNGRCEFLAVAPMAASATGAAEEEARAGAAAQDARSSATAAAIDAEPFPLPYALPE